MENITEVTNSALKGDLLERLSLQMNESESATRRGVEQAVPVSIAGLAAHVSSEQRAEELLGAFRGGAYPHLDAGELARAAADPDATSRMAQSSSGFLNRIFGSKLDSVTEMLAGHAGVSKGSAATLLGLATPMVLDAVGKEANARKLDARGLSRFLADQGRRASSELPGPLSSVVGGGLTAKARMEEAAGRARAGMESARGRVRGAVDEVRHRERGAAEVVHERRRGKSLGFWLAAGLVLLGLLFLLFGRRGRGPEVPAIDLDKPDVQMKKPDLKAPTPAAPKAPERIEAPRPAVPQPPAAKPEAAAPQPVQPQLPAPAAPAPAAPGAALAGATLSAATGAAALDAFLAGNAPLPGRFPIEGIAFSSGSSQFASSVILDQVADTLASHESAQVLVAGYADATGDPALNQALSEERAAAVKSYLTARGVAPGRIDTVGRGTEQPVAANETEQGRALNRRVELIVVER